VKVETYCRLWPNDVPPWSFHIPFGGRMGMPRKQTLFRQTNYSVFTGMCSVFVQDLCVTCKCEV
jgi:hypothetical protein